MTRITSQHAVKLVPMLLVLGLAAALIPAAAQAAPCDQPVTNQVACENTKPGTAPSDWQVNGAGDSTIQGYATSMSVTTGQTINFKIKSTAKAYHIDILRLGYYQGNGARKVAANLTPSATLPQTQPACQTFAATGLIDCGNWAVSASWTVPADAVSGVYIAHLVRNDTGGSSQIPFVVRDDTSHSDLLVSTSDATWQAYNAYGGNSLYGCTVACPPGAPLAYKGAFAVSYNRPWDGSLASDNGMSYLYYAEYQMIRFLERNGFDVSYTSEADVDRNGAALLNHRAYVSSGHDEYWSPGMRANVKAARDAGVNVAFFSGNEMFWKTRWAASSDGSSTPYRTLTAYKDTHFDAPTDPVAWTGTWRDPRFSPPGDGGQPENALTGQYFVVNSGTSDISVPAQFAKLRFWRNTAVANLTGTQTLTLSPGTGTLGYEWDTDADNGFRPSGQFHLSSTTVTGTDSFTDYGSSTAAATQTHNLVLYRAPSGALVFGAGTVQWAWGLDATNAWGQSATRPSTNPTDPNIQQATVNLFAEMGAQPATLQSGLTLASKSTDTTAPTSTITSPVAGATVPDGTQVTISGTASDAGGVVAGVEVSTNGGTTWHPATGTSNWTYTWMPHGSPSTKILSRAVDDSGNLETPSAGNSVTIACPCTLFGQAVPPVLDEKDANAVEVGVKFTSDVPGTVSGIRFYKSSLNTGTHIGNLWTASGTRLATATFSGETATGWQTVKFASPVTIAANTTYLASYFAPKGHYSVASFYFFSPPAIGGNDLDPLPLHLVGANGKGPDGSSSFYGYSTSSTFPTSSYQAENYYVDVLFSPTAPPPPVTPPGGVGSVTATAGQGTATVTWSAPTTGGAPSTYTVTPYIGTAAQTPKTVAGSPPVTNATLTGLTAGQAYTFTVTPSNSAGNGPESAPSNAVTPTSPPPATAPGAPTAVTATGGAASAQVSWTAPASDGGSPLTGYVVTPYLGTSAQATTTVAAGTTSTKIMSLTNGSSYTFTVKATNAIGTSPESAASNAVTPNAATTIFASTATPAEVDSGDTTAVELGVKFTSDVGGTVTGVRFYKASTNTGTHTGSLWSSTGTRLATATFSGETASGWQQVTFATPVTITANTTYVASYFAPKGHYSDTTPGFTSAVDNAPLHALANSTSANGVYTYSATSAFPTSTFSASNYWVDVVFAPAPSTPPGGVGPVSATAGQGSATVSWSAPTSGGAPNSYKVTPYVGTTAQTPKTVTGSPPATSATVTGLTAGHAYTFTVTPSNSAGSGPESGQSNAVTPSAPPPATAPGAPTGVTATGGAASAQVSWTAPSSDGGSPLTGYVVTPYLGAAPQATTTVAAGTTSTKITGLTNGSSYTFTVKASNAIGTGPESAASNAVTPQATLTIFPTTATPAEIDSGDTTAVELGMKFTSDVPGTVTGIRFYKASTNTGTHTGSLWSSTGTRLATATFTGETASGWQQVNFATPVAITANTTYVASYYAPVGRYSDDTPGFTSAFDNPPLHALANSTSANGVYTYSATSAFPSSTFNASNYWVDVVFAPAG